MTHVFIPGGLARDMLSGVGAIQLMTTAVLPAYTQELEVKNRRSFLHRECSN